ncbi:MAG: thiamine-binding protein [Fusobacteriaceae bacterium]|nr:thiamine-binding protein [Fusobacteriaceae bacterium]MBP9510530.1 thiamine-binding protein [Fusobacteriaceae bacterium]
MENKKMNASVSLQVLPRVEVKNLFPVVDKVIEYIASTGVNYVVGPMETTMEGDLETLLDIVKKAQYICIEEGAENVYSYVKINYSKEGVFTIDEKIGKYKK